jgi:glycosyltransferase involved in cell wall biosynthesis
VNPVPPTSPDSIADSFTAPAGIKRRIFVVHPSARLTDYQAHGDGLLSYRYICELAARGYHISVACESVKLNRPLPNNVALYPMKLVSANFGLLKRVEYAWRMRRLFQNLDRVEHFDVAHQFNPVYAGLSLGLIGLRVPVVLGPYVSHWPFKRASKLKAFALDAVGRVQQRFADAIVVSGPAARSRIVSKSVHPQDIYTVPYGIDLDMFPEAPLPSGDPTILYLAGLSGRKGILVLLAAFDVVASRVPSVRLIVAGDGPERERVRAVADKSPYRERITFAGSIARQNVPKVLASCSVFCLPSFGEPYGMSLVEAMATGRPVVATDSGGPVDLVDARGGFLVPPGDVPLLAQALEKVLTDPDAARAMGAFNRQAMAAYDWPNVIDRLERVYAAVIRLRSGEKSTEPLLTREPH